MGYKQIVILLITILVFALSSCKEGPFGGVGPCIHENLEAIFHVASVEDSTNNYHPTLVKLTNFRINGLSQTGKTWFGYNSYSFVAVDSIFYCNIPFGIEAEAGTYQFTLECEGYEPKDYIIENVDYTIFKGGCPSYADGGKRVKLYINK